MRTIFLFLLLLQTPSIPKEELLGQFDQSQHPDFILVETKHASKPGLYLRIETYEAFKKMADQAAKDGVKLTIVSATRNFNYQKGIWERKWNKPKYMGWQSMNKTQDILRYSSMPGTSRHHWGTDIDLNQLENSWFEQAEGKKLYNWLTLHGADFGFQQVYTSQENGRTGYQEEKWHWSYMPLAKNFLAEYLRKISYSDLNGFEGDATAADVKAIRNYVKGIE
ncbi:MAG: D-alanyl-D-alanine carboxypeptidase [Flavobacteriales bacterium]|jgi:D-alanyl-D-alanine carboxypeptidase